MLQSLGELFTSTEAFPIRCKRNGREIQPRDWHTTKVFNHDEIIIVGDSGTTLPLLPPHNYGGLHRWWVIMRHRAIRKARRAHAVIWKQTKHHTRRSAQISIDSI